MFKNTNRYFVFDGYGNTGVNIILLNLYNKIYIYNNFFFFFSFLNFLRELFELNKILLNINRVTMYAFNDDLYH